MTQCRNRRPCEYKDLQDDGTQQAANGLAHFHFSHSGFDITSFELKQKNDRTGDERTLMFYLVSEPSAVKQFDRLCQVLGGKLQ